MYQWKRRAQNQYPQDYNVSKVRYYLRLSGPWVLSGCRKLWARGSGPGSSSPPSGSWRSWRGWWAAVWSRSSWWPPSSGPGVSSSRSPAWMTMLPSHLQLCSFSNLITAEVWTKASVLILKKPLTPKYSLSSYKVSRGGSIRTLHCVYIERKTGCIFISCVSLLFKFYVNLQSTTCPSSCHDKKWEWFKILIWNINN